MNYETTKPKQLFSQHKRHSDAASKLFPYKHHAEIDIKQQLINYIYSTVELSNFKYKILEYEHDLPLLTKSNHFVSANFSGSNCLLVFIKVRDKFYSYLVDRKTLSYNQHQVNIDNVKIMQVSLRLDPSIYQGSVFDGILIQNKTKMFVITDIYMFKGRSMSNDKIQFKIINLVSYLKANLKDDRMNNLHLTVNKLYKMEQIETLLKEIPNMKNYNIKGLAFYPEVSGTKLIYMLDNDNRSSLKKQVADIKTNDNNKVTMRYICKTDDVIYATFELKKTKDSDVYKLYLLESVKRDQKTILKTKKMGIAFIPTTDCSIMCRDAFNSNNKVFMKCKFIIDRNKWQPIELDNSAKFPTNITEIESKLQILEESCSDNDDD